MYLGVHTTRGAQLGNPKKQSNPLRQTLRLLVGYQAAERACAGGGDLGRQYLNTTELGSFSAATQLKG